MLKNSNRITRNGCPVNVCNMYVYIYFLTVDVNLSENTSVQCRGYSCLCLKMQPKIESFNSNLPVIRTYIY